MVVAWMQESVGPARTSRSVRGAGWPSNAGRRLALRGDHFSWATGVLSDDSRRGPPAGSTWAAIQSVGLDGGAWCADAKSADLPLDQRSEDARSMLVSPPRRSLEVVEILGFPEARLRLSADRPLAPVSAGLCEVRPDGDVAPGDARPAEPVPPRVTHRAGARGSRRRDGGHVSRWTRSRTGSRPEAGIRLSVSPCYWPLAWPRPGRGDAAAALWHRRVSLSLPARPARARGRDDAGRPGRTEEPEPLAVEQVRPGSGGGRSDHSGSQQTGSSELVFDRDLRRDRAAPERHRLRRTPRSRATPSSRTPRRRPGSRCANTSDWGRDDREVRIRATGVMTATATAFHRRSRTSRSTTTARRIADPRGRTSFPRDHG